MVIGTSILVVEDDGDVLESVREVLEEAGYQVVTARNGVEAMSALGQMAPPAAMLVDSLMAGMSGAEFLKACAADPKLAAIPAIVISGQSHAAFDVPNVHGFVPKPFGPDELLGPLARLVKR